VGKRFHSKKRVVYPKKGDNIMRSQSEIQAELDAVTAEDLADEARIVELNTELAEVVAYDAGPGNVSAGPVEETPAIETAATSPDTAIVDINDEEAPAPDAVVEAASPAADAPAQPATVEPASAAPTDAAPLPGTPAPAEASQDIATAPPVDAPAPEAGAVDAPAPDADPVAAPADTPPAITADDVLALEEDAVKADFNLLKTEVLALGKKVYGEAVTIEDGVRAFALKIGGEVKHVFNY
jgi:hypothetical protein